MVYKYYDCSALENFISYFLRKPKKFSKDVSGLWWNHQNLYKNDDTICMPKGDANCWAYNQTPSLQF